MELFTFVERETTNFRVYGTNHVKNRSGQMTVGYLMRNIKGTFIKGFDCLKEPEVSVVDQVWW